METNELNNETLAVISKEGVKQAEQVAFEATKYKEPTSKEKVHKCLIDIREESIGIEMQWVKMKGREELWQCPSCGIQEYHPRGTDAPFCNCTGVSK